MVINRKVENKATCIQMNEIKNNKQIKLKNNLFNINFNKISRSHISIIMDQKKNKFTNSC